MKHIFEIKIQCNFSYKENLSKGPLCYQLPPGLIFWHQALLAVICFPLVGFNGNIEIMKNLFRKINAIPSTPNWLIYSFDRRSLLLITFRWPLIQLVMRRSYKTSLYNIQRIIYNYTVDMASIVTPPNCLRLWLCLRLDANLLLEWGQWCTIVLWPMTSPVLCAVVNKIYHCNGIVPQAHCYKD